MVKVYLDGVAYNQFGHDIFFTQLKLKTLLALFEVDSNVQRELDPQRKMEIRTFILENLEQERTFHFKPFVFNARSQIKKDEHGYYLEEGSKLFISDGQRRAFACDAALTTLKTALYSAMYIKNEDKVQAIQQQIKYLEDFPITMQIYMDLNVKQSRQLFSDINTERLEAHPGQMLQYDHRDEYSILTRKLAQHIQSQFDIEMKAARIANESASLTSLVIMKRCIVALFDGLYVQKVNKRTFSYPQHEVEQIAEAFFLKWLQIFPRQAHKRAKYVTGLTGIQVALALTVHHLTKSHKLSYLEAIEQLTHLKHCSWAHSDPMFAFLYSKEKKRLVGHSNSYAINRIKNQFVQVIQQGMAMKV